MIWEVYRQKLEEVSDVAPIDLTDVEDDGMELGAPPLDSTESDEEGRPGRAR